MATSPLFGWEEPDDIDLVKDGAAAMRTLGNAIDTSMGDLLGGTTGQVLSKASNTNMDFAWVAQDDSNAIQNAIVDAKGDLIAASANDVPARLAVGNNGETLVADSSTTTGLRYNPTTGNQNFLINGGQDIWQRGTTFTGTGWAFISDRWAFLSISGNSTLTRETSIVPIGFKYSAKFTAGATITGYLSQSIETLNTLQLVGKTIAFSAQVAASTSIPLQLIVEYSTTVDASTGASWTGITATSGGTATPTSTTFVPISGTYAIPSNAQTIRAYVRTVNTITTGQAFYFGASKLEIGNVPTNFTKAGGTIQGELAACQRYYYRQVANTGARFGDGHNNATTQAEFITFFPVEMRVAPTALETTGTATDYSIRSANANTTASGVPTFNTGTNTVGQFLISVASGLTLGFGAFARSNATGAYLGWSAEL